MDAPGGYYTGPPAVPHDKHTAPPPPPSETEPKTVDAQVNAPAVVPGGYYNGPALKADAAAAGGQGSSAAPQESGFLANCCPCLFGGGTAK